MKKIKVALYQCALKSKLSTPVLKKLIQSKPDFLVLPEYFFFEPLLNIEKNPNAYTSEPSEKKLRNISLLLKNTVIIGGSMITKKSGQFFNTCILYLNGMEIGRYNKQRLFEREIGKITTGNQCKVFEVKGIKVGVLICADVFETQFFEKLKKLQANLIFIPTFSPYKKESIEEKLKRDEAIFLNGAKTAQSYIVKTCGITNSRLLYSIQGRSLIASPERILWRTPFRLENKEILKIANLRI